MARPLRSECRGLWRLGRPSNRPPVCCTCSGLLMALSGESQGVEFTSASGRAAEVHGLTASAAFEAYDPEVRLARYFALQRAPDLMLADPVCCELGRGADAFPTAEETGVHQAARRRSDVAAGGARAAGDSSGRFPQPPIARVVRGANARISPGLKDAGYIEGRTSRSNTAGPTTNMISFRRWRPNWSAAEWR